MQQFFFEHYTVFRGTITDYGFTFVMCCNSVRGGTDFSKNLQRLLTTVVCDIMNLDICSTMKYLQLGQFRCGQLATVSQSEMTQTRHLVADNYNSAL